MKMNRRLTPHGTSSSLHNPNQTPPRQMDRGLGGEVQQGLSGKTVVITRSEEQSHELAQLLRLRGATPILYPCVTMTPVANTQPLDEALQAAGCGEYDWLIVTSANVVRLLIDRCNTLTLTLTSVPMAVVGAKTAQLAQDAGWCVAHQATCGEVLAETLPDMGGARILLPQSDVAPETLHAALMARGADVTRVCVYHTSVGTGGAALPMLLAENVVDAITLCSPSAVRYLIQRLMNEQGILAALNQVAIACIGDTTAEAAYQQGLYVTAIGDNTLAGMVTALEQTLK